MKIGINNSGSRSLAGVPFINRALTGKEKIPAKDEAGPPWQPVCVPLSRKSALHAAIRILILLIWQVET